MQHLTWSLDLLKGNRFEPTDKELNRNSGRDGDKKIPDQDDYISDDRKGKSSARTRNGRKLLADSENDDDDDSDDEMSDFIVESDEDEQEKDARRSLTKRLGKKCVHLIFGFG